MSTMEQAPVGYVHAGRKGPGTFRQIMIVAKREMQMILRNKTVSISAIVIPLALSAFIVLRPNSGMGTPAVAVVMISIVAMYNGIFSVYFTLTTTMTTRREDLYLKRLRTSSMSDGAIISAIVLPVLGIAVFQTLIVAAGLVWVGTVPPTSALLFGLAMVGLVAMSVTAALLTANFTPSASAAQITVMPFMLVFLGTMFWAQFAVEGMARYAQVTPGGSFYVVLQASYEGGAVAGDTWLALIALFAWAALFGYLASTTMKWEKR